MRGTLAYADVYDAPDARLLDDAGRLNVCINRACARGGATVLRVQAHEFTPQGVTSFAVLAESHAAVHTYPESRSYMVDVFTCGHDADAVRIATLIMHELGGVGRVQKVERGDDVRRQGQGRTTDKAHA